MILSQGEAIHVANNHLNKAYDLQVALGNILEFRFGWLFLTKLKNSDWDNKEFGGISQIIVDKFNGYIYDCHTTSSSQAIWLYELLKSTPDCVVGTTELFTLQKSDGVIKEKVYNSYLNQQNLNTEGLDLTCEIRALSNREVELKLYSNLSFCILVKINACEFFRGPFVWSEANLCLTKFIDNIDGIERFCLYDARVWAYIISFEEPKIILNH